MIMKNKFIKTISIFISAVVLITSLSGFNIAFASSDNQIMITQQPQDNIVSIGDTAGFTIAADGSGLQYQWQLSSNSGITWENSAAKGNKTNNLSFPVTNYSYKLIYRCIITDTSKNSIASDICRVSKKSDDEKLQIITHPSNTEAAIGDTVSLAVNAIGSDITYQWQLSSNNGITWANSSAKGNRTATISFPVSNYSYKLIYRCIITDASKNSIVSDPCCIIEKKNYIPVQITKQPENTEANMNSTALFTLSAVGNNIVYQWQISTDQGKTWISSTAKGNKTHTLSFPVIKYTYNRLYRCVLTDSYGNLAISDVVKVSAPAEKNFILTNTDYDSEFSENKYKTIIGINDFLNNAILVSADSKNNASVKYSCNINLNTDDLHILKLTLQAEKSCSKISIKINDNAISATYPVYTQKSDYYIPITNTDTLNSIAISLITDYQPITISDFQFVNFAIESINNHRTGIYPKNINETVFEENDTIGEATTASIADSKYLYSVNKGILTVYDITGNTPSEAASLEGLGNCHDISFINDGKALVISSRENGAYFVDIDNPLKPVLAGKYATLELSSGLAVNGSYAFICSRYFGVEIVDASDIYNPKYYSQISNREEMYDCSVDDHYLYIGVWAQKKIIIYDINDLRKPIQINTINLDGNVGGIVVENGILYAATGYHSRDNSTAVSSPGFGMGNGLEIYNVKNPQNPVWLSTNKIDGRYKYSGFDYWKVKVSGRYAILASTYNGLYVYDTSNLSAPILINKSTIRIEKDSPNYKKLISGSFIFNFDTSEFNQAPVLSVCTATNKLFFGDPYTGIYQISLNNMKKEIIPCTDLKGTDKSIPEIPVMEGYTANIITANCSVYAAKYANNLIYIASSNGITVLDENLNEQSNYITDSPVKDIAISKNGKYLYTAECDDGIGIYSIDKHNIAYLGGCKDNTKYNFSITSLSLTADENYIIAQGGFSRICTIDIKDKHHPVICSLASGGSMYYRNICQGLIADKYTAVCDNGKINLFTSDGNSLTTAKTITNSVGSETNGMAAYNNCIVAIYNNGYVYFNPMTENQKLSSLPLHKISGISYLRGKPVIYGDIMIVSYCYGKEITIVNISDLDNPKLIAQLKIDASLDLAEITDNFIIIPMRNDGILILKKDQQVTANV